MHCVVTCVSTGHPEGVDLLKVTGIACACGCAWACLCTQTCANFTQPFKGRSGCGFWQKVMVPSVKWQVKEENVYSQCRKPSNDCLRGKMQNTHTPMHTHTWFFLLLYLHLPLSRQPAFGESWQEASSFHSRLTVQLNQVVLWKLRQGEQVLATRQEKQKIGREFCQCFNIL